MYWYDKFKDEERDKLTHFTSPFIIPKIFNGKICIFFTHNLDKVLNEYTISNRYKNYSLSDLELIEIKTKIADIHIDLIKFIERYGNYFIDKIEKDY